MNIGVLGGTFDPVHVGHLILAEEARIKLGLSKVLFVPAGHPWLKAEHVIAAQEHRLEMVRRAIASNPYFELCTLELEHSGPSYTVDTIAMLREQLGAEASFFFLLGRDALGDLPLWKEPGKLVQICKLVVASRLSSSLSDLNSLESAIPGVLDSVIELDMPVIDISSSEIRRRLARGLSVRYLVPDGVAEYIITQKIYPASDS
ncbi:MAG: nicotinate-nucleotide adenylyltransferase [Dehalococcoidia bacterium]|nr:nicotinate-nucleotide adenylyltransferase [Dehalococcoidia bacterium]